MSIGDYFWKRNERHTTETRSSPGKDDMLLGTLTGITSKCITHSCLSLISSQTAVHIQTGIYIGSWIHLEHSKIINICSIVQCVEYIHKKSVKHSGSSLTRWWHCEKGVSLSWWHVSSAALRKLVSAIISQLWPNSAASLQSWRC